MTDDAPAPPQYAQFPDWFEQWLVPQLTRKLSTGNREGTHTWCVQWWRHTEVACRVAFLHKAWEASRISKDGAAMSAWYARHLDPQLRAMLDAASGPMWRCTPERHHAVASLPFQPVPDGWFPTTREAAVPNAEYPYYFDWFEDWLAPQLARKLAAGNREGNLTWCAQWWRHPEVACRVAFLHLAWEASCMSKDGAAVSAWYTNHLDPHLRLMLDAARGPLSRCTPERHVTAARLPIRPVPHGWFSTAAETTSDLGFGPDFHLPRTA